MIHILLAWIIAFRLASLISVRFVHGCIFIVLQLELHFEITYSCFVMVGTSPVTMDKVLVKGG
jgi:hypothetical protein